MGLLSVVSLFAVLFVGQTINRIPRDILVLRDFYHEKNWTEFYAHLAVTGFFWVGSVLLVLFVFIPFLGYEIGGWSKILDIVWFLGR